MGQLLSPPGLEPMFPKHHNASSLLPHQDWSRMPGPQVLSLLAGTRPDEAAVFIPV